MKKYIKIFLIIVIVIAAAVLFNPNTKHNAVKYVKNNSDQLEQLALDLLDKNVSVTSEYNNWKLDYFANTDTPVVQFTVKSDGIVASSSYKGFYYSPDDTPIGFQGIATEFVQDGNKWKYVYEGDNAGFTEKICDNWYWFEMKT